MDVERRRAISERVSPKINLSATSRSAAVSEWCLIEGRATLKRR
jgi:hypothetical protein